MCGARDHRNGKTRTSLSTKAMPRFTCPLKFRIFGQDQHDGYPPYSHDLAPCDFFLFSKLKLQMESRRFDTIEEIQEESQQVLDTIQKIDFQGCFQARQKTWDRCIRAKGEYFEGDGRI